MNPSEGVNSIQWWNEYFRADWERHGGPEQTRHFMRRLLESLPEVDRALIGERELSILDWGCALGDGCDELARAFPRARITGLDAAAEAIRAAQARFPQHSFQVAGATQAGALPGEFDVVVNSNCLEHFELPLDVLAANLRRTRLLHLTMVPYREAPLSVHHRVQLNEDSFPASLQGFTRLFAMQVAVDPTFWPSGRQMLVAYASPAYLTLRSDRERAGAERAKWNAYYESLPLVELDPLTRSFNDELVAAARELLPDGGRILEAGCGGGNQSVALAMAGFEVTLLDFSSAALEHARRRFADHGVKASFIEEDAFAPGRPEYDLVFNAGVLEHYTLDEQARFLRGMASRSRRFVLALIPNRACYWYWVWRARRTSQRDWPFGRETPQTTLVDAFEAAGLHYVGERYLGAAWSESFIHALSGIDAETRELLVELHKSPVLPSITKGYLLSAVGSVRQEAPEAFPAWTAARAASVAEIRRNEEWTALLADAIALKVGIEAQLERQRHVHADERARLNDELARLSSELAESRSRNKQWQAQMRQAGQRPTEDGEASRALLATSQAQLQAASRELDAIHSSRAWRLVRLYRRLRERWLPRRDQG